jgi:organic radical activating enzyme
MKKLRVNEIFYSIQGEGLRVGTPNIFIRLARCNLTCWFCDTDYWDYIEMTLDEVYDAIQKYPCKSIIWTGGEPTLQLTEEIVAYFKDRGYYQAIETNGLRPVPKNLDWVCVSPKTDEVAVKECDEVKILFPLPESMTKIPDIKAKVYFLSPINYEMDINYDNAIAALEEVLKRGDENFRFSLQLHKVLKIK